jgi:hypothetical protein
MGNGYCLEDIKWAKGPYCRQYFGTAGFLFSLSAHAPPARCVWRPPDTFSCCPLQTLAPVTHIWEIIHLFWQKRWISPMADKEKRTHCLFNIFQCCLRGRSMHDINSQTTMRIHGCCSCWAEIFSYSMQGLQHHCSSDRWTMRAVAWEEGACMITLKCRIHVFMLLNLDHNVIHMAPC